MSPTAHHSTMRERRNCPLTCSLRPVIFIVEVGRPIGMRGHHLWVDDVGLGLRLRYGDARLQQANHRQHVSPGPDVIHDDGGKNIRLYPGMKDTAEVKAGGQHADDGYGAIVERNRLTHNRRIGGELPLPEGMAQQNRWPAAFDGLLGGEETPKLGLNAEHLKEIVGYPYAGQHTRLAAARHFRIRRCEERYVGRYVLKGLVVASNLLVGIDAEGGVGEGSGPVVTGDPS